MTEREKSLLQVQTAEFSVLDAALFLDTHPNNRRALEFFRQMVNESEAARAAYVASHGPLTIEDVANEGRWTWVDGQWPWEREE